MKTETSSTYDPQTNRIDGTNLSEFSKILEIKLFADPNKIGDYNLDLTCCRENDVSRKIEINFKNISGLSLASSGQIIGLSIKDISSNGWESKKSKVGDYENLAIEFYCDDFYLTMSD